MIERIAFGVVACVLIAASAVMSISYASTLSDGPERLVWCAIAASCAVLKVALYSYVHGKPWRDTSQLRAAWLLALLVDASFIGGFRAVQQERHAAPILAEIKKRDNLTAALADLTARIDVMPRPRELETVETDLAVARREAGQCRTRAQTATPKCQTAARLERETADTRSYRALAAQRDATRAALSSTQPVALYPEVSRLTPMLRAAGLTVADATASLALWSIILLALDVCAMAAWRLARAPVTRPRLVVAPIQTAEPAQRVLEAVRRTATARADGWSRISRRAVHAASGVPLRAVDTHLAAMAAAGLIATRATGRMIDVRLLV